MGNFAVEGRGSGVTEGTRDDAYVVPLMMPHSRASA